MFDDEQSPKALICKQACITAFGSLPTHKTAQKFMASGPFYVMAKYLLIDSRYLSAYQVS
jgi:hypothetical protein